MAANDTDDFLKIMLVGKTGDGKSATGNSIVGTKTFKSTLATQSVTKKCQRAVARVQGHNVIVVDSPGLADTDTSTEDGLKKLCAEIITIFTHHLEDFDVILIAVKFGRRLTKEDKTVFKQLKAIFGKQYVKDRGILVVTCADLYDPEENHNISIEEFFMIQKGLCEKMRNKCNDRVVFINNKNKDLSILQAQVKHFLVIAAGLKEKSLTYTPQIFAEAQKARDKAIKENKRPIINEAKENNLKLITNMLGQLPFDSANMLELKYVAEKLDMTRQALISQHKNDDSLKDLMFTISRLEIAVKDGIEILEKKGDITEIKESISVEIVALQGLLQKFDEQKFVLFLDPLTYILAIFVTDIVLPIFSAIKFRANEVGRYVLSLFSK